MLSQIFIKIKYCKDNNSTDVRRIVNIINEYEDIFKFHNDNANTSKLFSCVGVKPEYDL